MRKFSWYTIPVKLTDLSTVYQYAVDRFIPLEVDRHGFGRYIHIKKGTFVVDEDGGWLSYKPNMKGGHRHNHIYNVCNRILFRSKNGRKICIENKREWREIFELQVFGGMNPFCRVQFLDILKKGKYFKQIKRWRLKK